MQPHVAYSLIFQHSIIYMWPIQIDIQRTIFFKPEMQSLKKLAFLQVTCENNSMRLRPNSKALLCEKIETGKKRTGCCWMKCLKPFSHTWIMKNKVFMLLEKRFFPL